MKATSRCISLFLLVMSLTFAVACSSAKDSTRFAAMAAQGGMAEVELGKLAIERAADPSDREFGERMVEDHARANTQLKATAARQNLSLPSDLNSEQKNIKEKLSKLSGPEFDKEYMADMLKDHEADVRDFQKQASEGADPDIKAFAAKTLPTLEAHLQLARDVAKKIGVLRETAAGLGNQP